MDTISEHSHDIDSLWSGDHCEVEEEKPTIGKNESRRVWQLKFIVFLVVTAAAIGTALAVLFYTRGSEESQLEEQFNEYADKVFDSISKTFDATFGALDALAAESVTYAKSTNQEWPLVNIPFFGYQASKILALSNNVFVALCPVVRNGVNRLEWENFTATYGRAWVDEYVQLQKSDKHYYGPIITEWEEYDVIHGDFDDIPYDLTERPLLPMWHTYPVVPRYPPYNWDYMSVSFPETMENMFEEKAVTISEPYHLPDPNDPIEVEENAGWADWFTDYIPPEEDPTEPPVDISFPVFNSVDTVEPDRDAELVAMITSSVYIRDILRNILPPGSAGVIVVVENGCSPTFSYQVTARTTYLGRGDFHNKKFDHLGVHSTYEDLVMYSVEGTDYTGPPVYTASCPFTFHVYPTDELEAQYVTNNPVLFTVGAVAIFAVCALIFVIYDCSVERRQKIVLTTAEKTTAVVASLFPEEVRERLYQADQEEKKRKGKRDAFRSTEDLESALSADGNGTMFQGNPIAQLYPETTVMFADISGFTAWSSVPEPSQVFTLLETVYGAFDKLARERRVFKVETIGDSYVAVCGLPKPRRNHAVIMARFASDCREKATMIFRDLESTLGPGTAELSFRVGLNSGPTTAGVLRGEKSRFQLFGDTVNTAARMESNGQKGRIHVSQKTADLLVEAGKGHWVSARDTLVSAKGKGMMQTYWVDPNSGYASSRGDQSEVTSEHVDDEAGQELIDLINSDKVKRMIDWYTDALSSIFEKLPVDSKQQAVEFEGNPRDGITDTIDVVSAKSNKSTSLSPEFVKQLRDYVSAIAYMYKNNPFHNFEHATHVGMSVQRYLKKVKATKLTSEPLVQLAVVFSALIHDVDHPGVPNFQLVKESAPTAALYEGKSVAEQNSIDVAWNLLMESDYAEVRSRLDLPIFRQLLVNLVIATDIFDPELKKWRESRGISDTSTVLLEQVIQAADVSHTMQHWSVFLKWNRRLFEEMSQAYLAGRLPKDPRENWYNGELGFYDNYIIPMAERLFKSGMLGVDSVEYCKSNRAEWEMKGQALVEEWSSVYQDDTNY